MTDLILPQTLMFQELSSAPNIAADILKENTKHFIELASIIKARNPSIMVTCARGSSDMAASYAKTIFETRLGMLMPSYAPSMSSVYDTYFRNLDNSIFIVISQSGKSPDILASLIAAKEAGASTIALVNDENSPVAKIADYILPMCAGKENAVAATKSFIASLINLLGLLAHIINDEELSYAILDIPNILAMSLDMDWGFALDSFVNIVNMFVLSRSLCFGIGGEAALKLKETCAIHAENFSAAEVRHGPMTLIKKDFPLLMFPPIDAAKEHFLSLTDDFAMRGAKCFIIGEEIKNTIHLPSVKGIHPLIDPIAKILSFYKFAEELSRLRGFNPDAPPFLQKITQTL